MRHRPIQLLRRLGANGIWGSLTWSYDGVGNRTQEVLNDGSTVTTSDYGYPAGSNRLDDVTQGSSTVRSFTHDAAGNITHDDRAGTVYRYLYNDRGRLMQFRIDNQVRANYRYDFFERLNWRQTQNMTPAGATHYIQDLQGQLIVEATDTGAMLREYVWIDDMPLAVFADLDTASPQLYYVHPDHLNRPLRMTDGAQAVVWDTVYKPFGEVHSITGSATLNLRFPGQYFLIESGLHYNWHRHYDPTLGRYTRPDPMEFVDGSSLYAYALSAPTMEVDQEGLSSFREILRWFRYYQRLYRYGGKSGEEFIKHLRDQREAARRIEKLRERCRLARGKRERDELLEELREELHQYRGHDKEMWQKWPEAMRDLFT